MQRLASTVDQTLIIQRIRKHHQSLFGNILIAAADLDSFSSAVNETDPAHAEFNKMEIIGVLLNGKPITSVVPTDTTTNFNTSTEFGTGSSSIGGGDSGGSSTNDGMRSDGSGGGELVDDEDYLWGVNVRAWSVILSCGTHVQQSLQVLARITSALARVGMLGVH